MEDIYLKHLCLLIFIPNFRERASVIIVFCVLILLVFKIKNILNHCVGILFYSSSKTHPLNSAFSGHWIKYA